jgi:hypothetical protein
VLGSASIPFFVEPRRARIWASGMMRLDGNDVTIDHHIYGLPDPQCRLRIYANFDVKMPMPFASSFDPRWDMHVTIPCVQPGIAVRTSQPLYGTAGDVRWRTMLRISDSDRRLLQESRVIPIHAEFTTVHQLVDGGVTDDIPFRQALEVPLGQRLLDTIMVLSTGYGPELTREDYRGGRKIIDASLQHLLETFSQRSTSLFRLEAVRRRRLGSPFTPDLELIGPKGRTPFKHAFDVCPAKIRRALAEGCLLGAEYAKSRRLVHAPHVCADWVDRVEALAKRTGGPR